MMPAAWTRLAAALGCLVLAACTSLGESDLAGTTTGVAPGLAATASDGTETWLIPFPAAGTSMRATLHRPPGPGPFRLAVVNHGSEQDPVRRTQMPQPQFSALTAWLLARNYAVLVPLRPATARPAAATWRTKAPATARISWSRQRRADAIAAAVDYMSAQPFIRSDGVIVVGNSAAAGERLRSPHGTRRVSAPS